MGWHLSVREFLQVLRAFRRAGAIVSPACADTPNVFNLVADAIGESMELPVVALLTKVVGRLFGG